MLILFNYLQASQVPLMVTKICPESTVFNGISSVILVDQAFKIPSSWKCFNNARSNVVHVNVRAYTISTLLRVRVYLCLCHILARDRRRTRRERYTRARRFVPLLRIARSRSAKGVEERKLTENFRKARGVGGKEAKVRKGQMGGG